MQSCARMRTAVRALTAKGQQGYGLDVRLSSPEPMLTQRERRGYVCLKERALCALTTHRLLDDFRVEPDATEPVSAPADRSTDGSWVSSTRSNARDFVASSALGEALCASM